jgi:DNA polymerase-3 subunit delta'
MHAFTGDARVKTFLRTGKEGSSDPVRVAAGAPGRVLAGSAMQTAAVQAQRLVEAATSANRAAVYRAALAQGAAGARGGFTDTLDALEVLLHERVRTGVSSGNDSMATGAAKALEVVERTKEQAAGNVNPQLLTAALLRDMTAVIK